MYILGINAFHGDASAALLHEGELVIAVEEERLNRVKHCAGFPTLAIRACMSAGIFEMDMNVISSLKLWRCAPHRYCGEWVCVCHNIPV